LRWLIGGDGERVNDGYVDRNWRSWKRSRTRECWCRLIGGDGELLTDSDIDSVSERQDGSEGAVGSPNKKHCYLERGAKTQEHDVGSAFGGNDGLVVGGGVVLFHTKERLAGGGRREKRTYLSIEKCRGDGGGEERKRKVGWTLYIVNLPAFLLDVNIITGGQRPPKLFARNKSAGQK
jgi:hypothetical protein